jgi:tetratricopeptide (TPR) repeat protein
MSEAADFFLAGDFRSARHAFREVAFSGAGTPEAARASHSWGRCELALGRPGAARAAFMRALGGTAAGDSDLTDLRAYALAGLADAALASGAPAEALDHLQRIADEGLTGRLAADGLVFRRASALDGLGRTSASARDYRRLARMWPSSALAPGALARARALAPPGVPLAAMGPSAYEVRAGIYSSRNSAEEAADRLRGSGFRPRIAAVSAGRGTSREAGGRFIVSIGRFDRREDAERAAREAVRAGFPARVSP